MKKMTKLYKNFFEWYKEECDKWYKENPHCMCNCGIDDDVFIYFVEQYLYKGDKYTNDSEKLITILKKHSSRYRKEKFYLNIFKKVYRSKAWDEYYPERQTISEFCVENYQILPSDIYIRFIIEYLSEPYLYSESIGRTQMNLDSIVEILSKHSFRFRIEKYLFNKFSDKYRIKL